MRLCLFSIHKKDSPIVELEEVRTFHASLVKHTKEIIGLNLAAVPLMMYKTPDFELYATGKVDSILLFAISFDWQHHLL